MASFSEVLKALNDGKKARHIDMVDRFIYKVNGSKFIVNRPPLNEMYPEGTEINYMPHIDIGDSKGNAMVWTPSQWDIFRCDWTII